MEVLLYAGGSERSAWRLETRVTGAGRLGVSLASGSRRYLLSELVNGVDVAPDEFVCRARHAPLTATRSRERPFFAVRFSPFSDPAPLPQGVSRICPVAPRRTTRRSWRCVWS